MFDEGAASVIFDDLDGGSNGKCMRRRMKYGKRQILELFVGLQSRNRQLMAFKLGPRNVSGMTLEVVMAREPIGDRFRSFRAVVHSATIQMRRE